MPVNFLYDKLILEKKKNESETHMEPLTTSIIAIVAIVVLIAIVLITSYVKAPANKAYIISGFKKEPRVLIGRAGIKIPYLERKDELIIRQISIDIKTNGYIPTEDFIGVDIDAIAKVQVITYKDVNVDEKGNFLPGIIPTQNTPKITPQMAAAAMKNFLNMTEADIMESLTDSLQGNMREIIGTQTLKSLCNDRKGFGDQVQEKAQPDMNALGIQIISCNIQKIEDERGLITALGQDNMSKIQKDASIAKANADAEVAIAEATAKQQANEAEVAANKEIACKQNELAIAKANLKIEADTKQAEADAAYEIQQQEQRKRIEISTANANIAKQEKEIELKDKEAIVKEHELDASVRKEADAAKYEAEKNAEAQMFQRQKEADAALYEQKQKAEALKAEADANVYAESKNAEAIKLKGEAEAEAIRAKGVAEAEALDKKAEAMNKYGKAAMTEMIVKVLPDMAKAIAEPIGNVDKISIIDGGTGNGSNQMFNMVSGGLAKTMEAVKETTGLDLMDVMKAGTYDAKVNKNLNINGLDVSKEHVCTCEKGTCKNGTCEHHTKKFEDESQSDLDLLSDSKASTQM